MQKRGRVQLVEGAVPGPTGVRRVKYPRKGLRELCALFRGRTMIRIELDEEFDEDTAEAFVAMMERALSTKTHKEVRGRTRLTLLAPTAD